MLHALTLDVPIRAVQYEAVRCMVVFNYYEGEPETQWEPCVYPEIEIMDVFLTDGSNTRVYSIMTDEEEDYLKDMLFAVREDNAKSKTFY